MLANIIRNAKKTAIGGGGGGIVIDNGDPFYSAVSLLLPMDGTNGSTTFTDSSPNAIVVTAAGNAQISTTQSKYGGASAYFDGAGDYISATAGNQFQFGTGDFTIEMWVWASSNTGQYKCLFSNRGVDASSIFLGIDPSAKLLYYRGAFLITDSVALNLNQWYHIALVRNGSTITLYKNGVSAGSVTDSTNLTGNTCFVAQESSLASTYFNGFIDDLRISRFARYVSNFTPPTSALPTTASSTPADPYYGYTSLLLHMDGSNASTTFTDSGPSVLTVTRTGTPAISTAQSKYGGSSVALSGTTDRLDVASNALFAFGTSDFTVEFWLYFNSVSTAQTSFVNVNVAGGFSCYWTASAYYSVPVNNFVVSNRSVGQFQSTWIPSANTWYHVAISRSGTNLRVFINGTQLGSTVTSSTSYVQGPLQIGGSTDGAGWTVNGNIDDLRVTKYARYTSAFAPPAQALPNMYNPYTTLPVSGAALWLDGADSSTLYTDAGVTPVNKSGDLVYQWSDKSGNNRHATQATSGNRPTWVPPASGQNGFGAVSFNGSSSFVEGSWQTFDPLSIYMVFKHTSGTTGSRVFTQSDATNYDTQQVSGSTNWVPLAVVAGPAIASYSTTDASIGSVSLTSSTWLRIKHLRNGTSIVNSVTNTTSSTTISAITRAMTKYTLGRVSNFNGGYVGMQVVECVAFNKVLSTNEETSMNSYLKDKWGTP